MHSKKEQRVSSPLPPLPDRGLEAPPSHHNTDAEYLVLLWSSQPGAQQPPRGDVDDAKDQAVPCTVAKRTLLQIAAHFGSIRCASLLLARGANPGYKSSDGLTAYDVSWEHGKGEAGPCDRCETPPGSEPPPPRTVRGDAHPREQQPDICDGLRQGAWTAHPSSLQQSAAQLSER